MKLYIIGNGFDCFHNLPTTYEDFRKYLKEKDEEVYTVVQTAPAVRVALGEEFGINGKENVFARN